MKTKLNTDLISKMTGGLWQDKSEDSAEKLASFSFYRPPSENSVKNEIIGEQNSVATFSLVNKNLYSLYSLYSQEGKAELIQCSLRDFVKAISLPTKRQLYKSWFTVEEAIEGVNEHNYFLTTQTASEYLSLLVEKKYFEMRGSGRTAQYRKVCFSYQMDFWNT